MQHDDLTNVPFLYPVARLDQPLPRNRDATKAIARDVGLHPSSITHDLMWPATGFEAKVDGVTFFVWCHVVLRVVEEYGVATVWHGGRIQHFGVRMHDSDEPQPWTDFARKTFAAWWDHEGRDMVRAWREATE